VLVLWQSAALSTRASVLQDGHQRNNHPNQPYFRDFSPRKCSWLGLLHWLCDVTWMKWKEWTVGREGRVSAAHGIVGRVWMWEHGIGKKGARKWKGKKCQQSNARSGTWY